MPERAGMKLQPIAPSRPSLENFCAGYGCKVRKHAHARYTGQKVVDRAKTRLDEDGYSLFGNNCEHFCNWARGGSSPPVRANSSGCRGAWPSLPTLEAGDRWFESTHPDQFAR
jgi:Lecithin retinol acyltransferase